MKIEKVSDTQIKVTLNRGDLDDRNLKLSELAYGSQKAQALFRDMMIKANEQFGFETDNVPLMIEAVPLSPDSIMVVITKVEDPLQIEQKLETIGERPTHRTFKDPEEDRLTDLALMESSEVAPPKQTPNVIITYLFKDFDSVTMAAHRLQPMFVGNNSLYKYQDNYFLVLGKNRKVDVDSEGLVGMLDEFGNRLPNSQLNEFFFKEHGKTIIANDAVDILAKYL